MSTEASQAAEDSSDKIKETDRGKPRSETSDHDEEKLAMTKSNYWGLVPKKQYKEDGTPWRWTSFFLHRSYQPDVTIGLEKHNNCNNWTDSIAYWTVRSLRFPTDVFSRNETSDVQ